MDRNLANMSLTGSIWSKLNIFYENGQNLVILVAKLTSYDNICGNWPNKCSLKPSKNKLSQVYGRKFGQKCH